MIARKKAAIATPRRPGYELNPSSDFSDFPSGYFSDFSSGSCGGVTAGVNGQRVLTRAEFKGASGDEGFNCLYQADVVKPSKTPARSCRMANSPGQYCLRR